MGKRGPRPKPTAVKVFDGNPGKRPLPENEMQPKSGTPTCPEWIGEVGRRYWDDAIANLPVDVITLADGPMLALYASAWEDFHAARKIVAEEGILATSEKGAVYQHPAVGAMNKARESIKKLAGCFGLTPSDRVGLEFGDGKKKDTLGDFLGSA